MGLRFYFISFYFCQELIYIYIVFLFNAEIDLLLFAHRYSYIAEF